MGSCRAEFGGLNFRIRNRFSVVTQVFSDDALSQVMDCGATRARLAGATLPPEIKRQSSIEESGFAVYKVLRLERDHFEFKIGVGF